MSVVDERKRELAERYGELPIETGSRLQGEFFLRMVEEFDQLDEGWTQGLAGLDLRLPLQPRRARRQDARAHDHRRVLRVERLIQLPNHIRTALRVGATKEEVLEVILPGGMPKMIEAMRVYRSLMTDIGLLELEEPEFRGDARE